MFACTCQRGTFWKVTKPVDKGVRIGHLMDDDRMTLVTFYLNIGLCFLPSLFCLVQYSDLFPQGLQHGCNFFLKTFIEES